MNGTMTWVGLDVHARSTHAAALEVMSGELRRARFGIGVAAVVEWLLAQPQPVHACYEAGPTGYGLHRAASAAGVQVDVVAPTKTPRASADRIKTDRKDAELLCRLLMAGQLTPVAVPSVAVEAARDLTRAREQLRADLGRTRQRVSKLLLRYGRLYEDGSTWTQTHRRWLARQRFDEPATELAYLDALAAIEGLISRRRALDEHLSQLAPDQQRWPIVSRLRCFRGIETLTAFALDLEVGDWRRFERASQLAAWLGLVPSLHQSGESESRGPITKSGSGYARRLLVEAAWHQRRPLRPSLALSGRRSGQPAAVRSQAEAAARRLHQRWWDLERRGKRRTIVAVAVARELAGHCQQLATMD